MSTAHTMWSVRCLLIVLALLCHDGAHAAAPARSRLVRPALARSRVPRGISLHGGHHHHHDDDDDAHHGAADALGLGELLRHARAMVNHRWWAPAAGSARGRRQNTFLVHAEDRVTVIGAAVNVLLSVCKFAAGIYGRSAAMIADAAHSTSDLVSDVVTLWAVRMGRLPPDDDHPYGARAHACDLPARATPGPRASRSVAPRLPCSRAVGAGHGRFETLGSLVIAVMLAGTAWAIGAHSMSSGLMIAAGHSAAIAAGAAPSAAAAGHVHTHAGPGGISLAAALLSLLAKEWMYRLTAAVGRRQNSSVLMANALHHRSDALSSVVALVGIGGAMLGVPLLDPIAGMIVGAMLGVASLSVASEALTQLTDAVDESMISKIGALTTKAEGVLDYNDLRVRWSGSKLLVDVCVVTEPTISASAANDVAERVRLNILTAMPAVYEVLVRSTPRASEQGTPTQGEHATPPECPIAVINRRPRSDVEEDVMSAVQAGSHGVEAIEHLTVHYLSYDVAVEVAIKVRRALDPRTARHAACPAPSRPRLCAHPVLTGCARRRARRVRAQVDPKLLVSDAREIAAKARDRILTGVDDVAHADIHLDLLGESPESMFDDALARQEEPPTEAAIGLQGPLREPQP